MTSTRRTLLKSLSRTALVLPFQDILTWASSPQQAQTPPGMSRDTYSAPARPAPRCLHIAGDLAPTCCPEHGRVLFGNFCHCV